MYANEAICWDIYTRAPNGRAMDASVGLVEAARERREHALRARERWVAGGLSLAFVMVSVACLAWLPPTDTDWALVGALVLIYAIVSTVEFEVGNGYSVPEPLVFVPMLFMVPLGLVPLMVATGFILAGFPRWRRRETTLQRLLVGVSDSWFALGPVIVLGIAEPSGGPSLEHVELYVLAFAAQVLVGSVAATVKEGLGHGVRVGEILGGALRSYQIDAVLWPLGLMVATEATQYPFAVVTVLPLIWLLHTFSQERKQRYAASLELSRAYRGTVMLLSDVVEAEDNYTAEHCRSVVELVTEVAEEMRVPRAARQELEFAALLHDVGKIAVPKEILNKPSKLTEEEFEIIKRHTIEGQELLDRVGGLLGRVGQIVRSCHERWDGKGYPDGLAGERIPLSARIVFACDAYNAMTTDRPYRKAMSRDAALTEMRENSGTQFDPRCVAALERVVMSKVEFPQLVHAKPAEQVAVALGLVPASAQAQQRIAS
jgi:HD-GYP domain-containing protein (c-di-GMP phosphodiesterase class II)